MDRLRGYFDREGPLRPSTTVVLVSTVLTLLGIIMIGSVSTGPETTAADPYAFTVKQAIFAGVGVLIAFVVSRLPIDLILRGVRPLLLFTWALLVLVLLFGSKQLGATRWIAIGPFHVQPSEIAKVTLILVVAAWASAKAGELSDFRRGFGPGFGAILLTCLLVILEKDMGTTLFLFALGAGCMWAAGAMFRHLVFGSLIAFAAIGVAAGAMGSFDYVVRRLDGYASKSGAAHDQVAAGLDALRSGGVFGTGLGEGSAHFGVRAEDPQRFHRGRDRRATRTRSASFCSSPATCSSSTRGGASPNRPATAPRSCSPSAFRSASPCRRSSICASRRDSCLRRASIFPFVSYGGSSLLVLGSAVGLLLAVARENEAPAARPEPDELGVIPGEAPGLEGATS
jgi:cell division protein FtsW